MSKLTPYQRWQERTKDGRAMTAGWTSTKHEPTKNMVDYEVRGHPTHSILTWGYGQWWSQEGGRIESPWVGYGDARYAWRGPVYHSCHANWGHAVLQAARAGNEEAMTEVKKHKAERYL